MWIFRNGRLRFSTPVITGKTSTPTVVGNFNIYMRTRNTTLRGADYASDVDYWMPFYGGYGIHDAPWQPSGAYYYNSSWYRQNGSHGCINTPPSAMPTVWSLSFVGMPVTVVR